MSPNSRKIAFLFKNFLPHRKLSSALIPHTSFKILIFAVILGLLVGCLLLNSLPPDQEIIEIEDYPVAIW